MDDSDHVFAQYFENDVAASQLAMRRRERVFREKSAVIDEDSIGIHQSKGKREIKIKWGHLKKVMKKQ